MSLIVTSAVVKGIMIIFQPWNCILMHDGKSHGKMHPMSSVCFSQLLSAVGYDRIRFHGAQCVEIISEAKSSDGGKNIQKIDIFVTLIFRSLE
jgi:hypothetical protein